MGGKTSGASPTPVVRRGGSRPRRTMVDLDALSDEEIDRLLGEHGAIPEIEGATARCPSLKHPLCPKTNDAL